MPVLYYIHDPMCSWCYGFAATLTQLQQGLPDGVVLMRLLGGLAPDSDEPMSMAMRASIRHNWQRIEQTVPGVEFNYDFWEHCTPRRSTYPACRAVIAAREQGEQFDEAMTKAIQRAYYRQARNPSDDATLTELAGELGLDTAQFARSLNSPQTRQRLRQEMMQASDMGVASYPSLRLQCGERDCHAVEVDYRQVEPMLDSVRILVQRHYPSQA